MLRLTDCKLPCWIGIVPGQTRYNEAKERIMQTFNNAETEAFDDTQNLIGTVTDKANKFRIGILAESRIATGKNDPVVQSISVANLDSTDGSFSVSAIISLLGSPTTIAFFPFSGGNYTNVYFDHLRFSLSIERVRYTACSPLIIISTVEVLGTRIEMVKPAPEFIQAWRGFRTCYR